jgi:hypothetical protein
MAVGFGGDAKVALLTGLIGGMNKREENKRAQERQNILNQQALQQNAESEARVKNYKDAEHWRQYNAQVAEKANILEQQKVKLLETSEARKAQEKEDAYRARIDAITDAAMNNPQFAGWPREQTRALVEHSNPADAFDMAAPNPEQDKQDELNALELERLAKIERENAIPPQVDALQSNDNFKLLVAAYRRGDDVSIDKFTEALVGEGFFTESIAKAVSPYEPDHKAATRPAMTDRGVTMATTRFSQLQQEAKANAEAQNGGPDFPTLYRKYLDYVEWEMSKLEDESDPDHAKWLAVYREMTRLMNKLTGDIDDGTTSSTLAGEQTIGG